MKVLDLMAFLPVDVPLQVRCRVVAPPLQVVRRIILAAFLVPLRLLRGVSKEEDSVLPRRTHAGAFSR